MEIRRLHNSSFSFKERFFVMITPSPQESVGLIDATGMTLEALSKILVSGASLIDMSVGVVQKGVDLLDVGLVHGERAIKKVSEWIEDPGVPSDNLKEYRETTKYFPNLSLSHLDSEPAIKRAMVFQTRIALLTIRQKEIEHFMEPATMEFDQVKRQIGDIENARRFAKPRLEQVERSLDDLKEARDSGVYVPGDPRILQIETQIQQLEQIQAQLNAQMSYVVEWSVPQRVKVEFPPKSGKYEERLVMNTSRKCKMDLRTYAKFLHGYILHQVRGTEVYRDELEKLSYWRDRLIVTRVEELRRNNNSVQLAVVEGMVSSTKQTIADESKVFLQSTPAMPQMGGAKDVIEVMEFDLLGTGGLQPGQTYDEYREQMRLERVNLRQKL